MNGSPITDWATSPIVLLVIVPLAALAARLLTRGISTLVDPQPGHARVQWAIEVGVIVATALLWWWEVVLRGQIPGGVATIPLHELVARFLGHTILFLFLAAAAWVDVRHRVIPDAITVPGVLAGLAWNSMFPFTFLPIATYVERTFATPEIKPDLLTITGGLASVGLPGWGHGFAGLALAMLGFVGWWYVGTSAEARSSPSSRAAWLPSGPFIVAVIGIGCMIASWTIGGDHWAGFATALTGLAVSGGLVWATRIGASWALGREAMGFGDVTLMAMAGAWLGWQACLLGCLLGVFIGLVHGLSQLVVRSESELPFGPSLCLGLVAVVVAWRPLWERVGPQFDRPLEMVIVAALVIVLTAVTLWAWARFRGVSPHE